MQGYLCSSGRNTELAFNTCSMSCICAAKVCKKPLHVRKKLAMSQDICIAGWSQPPDDTTLAGLAGSVLHVAVGGRLNPTGTPWFELFRFARVIRTALSLPDRPATCLRCRNEARWRLTVEWEVGDPAPNGNVLCEWCVDGVVSSGAELIVFPTNSSGSNENTIT